MDDDQKIRRALIAAKTDRDRFETMEDALKRILAIEGLTICDIRLKPGTSYRHYKGGLYEIIGTARHSETEEELVVYRPLYGEQGLWVRPKAIFFDMVTVEGILQRRFKQEAP